MTRVLSIARVSLLEMARKKDVYVLLILLVALLVTLVSLNIFGLGGTARYVGDIGLLFAWLFAWILGVAIAARQLPDEETRGTIFPLLAKPVTRLELLAGKWLGAWAVTVAASACFYVLIWGVTCGRGGAFDLPALLQGFLLHAVAMAVTAAIAVGFSTRLNHDAAATLTYVLTAAAFLIPHRVPEFLATESGFKAGALLFAYNILPHFEVFDLRQRIVHGFGVCPWTTFALAVAYGAILTLFFLILGWAAYRGKRFSRGNIG